MLQIKSAIYFRICITLASCVKSSVSNY